MTQKVLSYDLGGTKVAVGVVNQRGRILDEVREPVVFAQGKNAVLRQLVDLGNSFLAQHPEIQSVGIASAGPLDPTAGVLLNPTNFSTNNVKWGKVPIVDILKKAFKRNVFLENDAAAAVLAEQWIGGAKKANNVMVLTLGTGLGTGIICNGQLVRSGLSLHPEAGHIVMNYDDPTAPCGCGNWGCAEAYLSGKHFTHRTRIKLNDDDISAEQIAKLARKGHAGALAAFDEYSSILAIAIQTYLQIYNPEIILFTGSFAAASDLFLPATKKKLQIILTRQRGKPSRGPKLGVSKLKNSAGLVGGAYVAIRGCT